MKKRSFYMIVAVVLAVGSMLGGCGGVPPQGQLSIARVQRGDLEVKVSADGNIEAPAAVNLYFDTTMFTPPYSARALPAYKIAETSPNFWNYTDSFTALTAHQSTDPDIFNGKPGLATHGSSGTHNTLGLLNRRLVVVPTMTNCSGGAAIGTGFACALMLNPFGKVGSNDINGKIEYLGPIGPDSPCGSAIADALNMAVLVK